MSPDDPDRVNVDDVAAGFDELWAPRLLAEANDTSVKLAKVAGEFVWHSHPDSDELFLVRSGHLIIRLDDGAVELGPGDLYVVPRGARHCPVSEHGAEVVLMERTGTLSTGDFEGVVPDHITSTTGLGSQVERVYVDLVGDLFHAGHVGLLRAAKARGRELVVGVLSDETAASYKRRPVMSLAERVAVVEACRYVDQVIADAPFEVDAAFLAEHHIDLVVHGDDLTPQGVQAVYGGVADRLALVPRTSGISTTDVIRRVLDRAAGG